MVDVALAQRYTVQDLPDVDKRSPGAATIGFWMPISERGPFLPAWGTRARERTLRFYDRYELNDLWQGARAGLTKKIVATPYELTGPKYGPNYANYFDSILREAQFGAGWGTFLSLAIRDFMRFDGGAYFEIIAPGNPLKAPTGRITGLAVLDSFHCLPTGDPEYPVVYYSRKGTLHLLHHTRVFQWLDAPDSDQDNPGYGESALSRAIALVQREILMGRYVIQNLDDKPSPGVVLANNMNQETRDAMFARFRGEQSTDLPPEWGKVAWAYNLDPSKPISLETFSFSRPPEKFDYKVYVEIDIDRLALAIGVDRQEIAQLSGGNIGSSGQSQIQHVKSQGKMPGYIYASLERALNQALPESCEFAFKVKDAMEAAEQATTAQAWAGFTASAGTSLTADEKRQILANQVEAVADAILDENGELIRLDDADPQSAEQVTAVNSAPNAPAADGQPQITAQDSAPNANVPAQKAAKDIQSTQLDFEGGFDALLESARSEDVNRRRFGIILRDLVRKYGDRAYRDGLADGGVTDDLDEQDRAAFTVMLAEQSAYVTSIGDTLFHGDGVTDDQASGKASMWFNKSISPFYQAGLVSADKNGVYEWVLGDAEHCTDCLAMSGQKHRMAEYAQKGILPHADVLECKGFNCACKLVKTSGRASGSWLN